MHKPCYFAYSVVRRIIIMSACSDAPTAQQRTKCYEPRKKRSKRKKHFSIPPIRAPGKFLGSGATLAAAALTERICYSIELDPKYVDVVTSAGSN